MTTIAAATAASWITELDEIDISWNVTPFIHSRLGRLPLELLESIIRYIPTRHLPAVARISSRLRELAEKSLYSRVDIGDSRKLDSGARKDVLWPLHCTLVRRPDLAQMVKEFSGAVYDRDVNIEVDTSTIFPGDVRFCSAAKVSLNQMVIGGRVLLQLFTNVEKLCLTLGMAETEVNAWVETTTCKHLALEPLSKLMEGFDDTAAHRLRFPGLQKLTSLEFAGTEFHWALAKFPCLRKLKLTRPCMILPDEAPNEVNSSLTSLDISARSEILRNSSRHYATLKAFLAHFPALEVLRLTTYDLDVDKFPTSASDFEEQDECSYSTLLERLSPVATHLTTLHLGIYNDAEDYGGCASSFLRDVQPAAGFRQFKALKNLVVPYQCLLGRTISTVDTLPSPATILPATLELLEVHCPQTHIYDWFSRLHTVRDRLPVLSEIELYCQLPYGDEYPLFAFENSDHPGIGTLSKIGVSVYITYREGDWKKEWDDYDDDIIDAINWLRSLGA